MAKFAQYYLEYLKDNMFADEKWNERQKHFGAYFESNESIDFSLGEDESRKTYKHDVYHLSTNKDIIVMRIANVKTKEVIQDFKTVPVRHEPPCFVIIDNRERCRRIAIQKNKESFSTTDSLKKIIQEVLDRRMKEDHYISLELHPQFYPRDFYKAWRLRQYTTSCIRFNINDGNLPDKFEGETFILPNTIVPYEGDYFEIKHVNGASWLFIVKDVQQDTIENVIRVPVLRLLPTMVPGLPVILTMMWRVTVLLLMK